MTNQVEEFLKNRVYDLTTKEKMVIRFVQEKIHYIDSKPDFLMFLSALHYMFVIDSIKDNFIYEGWKKVHGDFCNRVYITLNKEFGYFGGKEIWKHLEEMTPKDWKPPEKWW